MIKHSLLQAWRRIMKDRTYTVLNITGLSAGLACFALIALWANDELNFDRFNKNYHRIVRITEKSLHETGALESARSIATLATALNQDFPEVENAVRLRMREGLLAHEGKQSTQPGILLADPSIFDIFSYRLLRGNAETALNEPYTIILTESTAKKYFGNADPIGQSLTIFMNDTTGFGAGYKITGVVADPVQNAHFSFNMIASFKSVEVGNPDTWRNMRFYTYLLLRPGVDMKVFSKKIADLDKKYISKVNSDGRSEYIYRVQPLADIYLRSNLENEIGPRGNITRVYVFSVIGIFILLLACINYTNLATARSVARAREVGIKKIVGARKTQLIGQYLSESILVTFISFLLALLIAISMQSLFRAVTGKEISLFENPAILIFMAGASISIGILSGIYPAFILSSFKPVTVLKSSFRSSGSGALLRKSLVVAQFTITLVLVTGIVIIYSQMRFIRQRDLGFNKEALFFIRVNGNTDIINGINAFKNDLYKNTLIKGITLSNTMIGGFVGGETSETVDHAGKPVQITTAQIRADEHYLGVYDIRLTTGKNLPALTNQRITPVLVNETMVKKLQWGNKENAIGKPFKINGSEGTVIGVVSDFHFNSLQHNMEPLIIYPVSNRFSRISIRIDGTRPFESFAVIEKTWKKYFPASLMDYAFLDEQVQNQYQSEQRFSKIFLVFSILSLVIASLGLYGLTAYSTFQKTKEIGIRKVLGASVNGIVLMLSKDFFKLVMLSTLVALPVSWFIMNRWLENFAYHVGYSWWMFGLPALLVLAVAFISVSTHVAKAALANPLKSMRTE